MVVPRSCRNRGLARTAAGVGAVGEDNDRAGTDVRGAKQPKRRPNAVVDVRPVGQGGLLAQDLVDGRTIVGGFRSTFGLLLKPITASCSRPVRSRAKARAAAIAPAIAW